jgi:hypothetical protein
LAIEVADFHGFASFDGGCRRLICQAERFSLRAAGKRWYFPNLCQELWRSPSIAAVDGSLKCYRLIDESIEIE